MSQGGVLELVGVRFLVPEGLDVRAYCQGFVHAMNQTYYAWEGLMAHHRETVATREHNLNYDVVVSVQGVSEMTDRHFSFDEFDRWLKEGDE